MQEQVRLLNLVWLNHMIVLKSNYLGVDSLTILVESGPNHDLTCSWNICTLLKIDLRCIMGRHKIWHLLFGRDVAN